MSSNIPVLFRALEKSFKFSFNLSQVNYTAFRRKSVKSAVLEEFNQPLKVKEGPAVKKMKKNEIKIKVEYCAVNQSDYDIIKGSHEYKPTLPFIPGYEVCGKILEIGKLAQGKGFQVGDNVIGLNKDACGGFSEECLVVAEDCYQAPQGVSSKESCALLDGYTLALLGLVRRGNIKENDIVMVTAAGGGVGLSAVDLAANVYKAKVIAVCSTEDKAALVREKGAFHTLNYNDNLAKEVKNLTGGKGVKIVFDATGGQVFDNALKCVSNEGRMVVASNAARTITSISLTTLLPNSISLTGVSLWHYRQNDLETYRNAIEDVIDMAEQELITPHVSKEFLLPQINEAFEYLLDSKCTGKVVVRINDDD